MKTTLILACLILAGCVSTEYTRTYTDGRHESYKLTSVLKSVDGLSAIRTPDMFGLKIDSTNTHDDAISDVARILEFYAGADK